MIAEKYREIALCNERLFESLHSQATCDEDRRWVITIMFYAALHWVNTVMAVCGIETDEEGSHALRSRFLNDRNFELVGIAKAYRNLLSASKDARYRGETFTAQDVQSRRSSYDKIKSTCIQWTQDHPHPTDAQKLAAQAL